MNGEEPADSAESAARTLGEPRLLERMALGIAATKVDPLKWHAMLQRILAGIGAPDHLQSMDTAPRSADPTGE